jgi:hypothetical protein
MMAKLLDHIKNHQLAKCIELLESCGITDIDLIGFILGSLQQIFGLGVSHD